MDDLLKNLNEKQREAVLAVNGPVLILAGPGSGKTRVLTHRVAHLVKIGVRPEHILAVTFTNKAAEEMRERIAALLGNENADIQRLTVGTFHAFCARILRQHASRIGYLAHFTIFDDDDSLSLIKEAMKELGINPKQFPPGMIMHTISGLKNELVTPEKYEEDAGLADIFPRTVHSVYVRYQEQMKRANAMDFDDLLLNLVLIFQKYPEILAACQDRFQYCTVDEYQDVNTAQYALINQIAGRHRNLAVVGDDAQAIYAFRGADFRNILNFERDWPDAKVIVLDQNYRSTQVILNAAREVIAKNRVQKEKNLWTRKGAGDLLTVAATENERDEAEYILMRIRDLFARGYGAEDIAILYRTNAQSRVLEEAFLQHNLPYTMIGGVRFYQRKEVKDIVAYLRLMVNSRDIISIRRIINVPARGIGKVALVKYLAHYLGDTGEEKSTTGAAVKKPACLPALAVAGRQAGRQEAQNQFHQMMRCLRLRAQDEHPSSFIRHLLSTIRYREYLQDASENSEERWENIQEFVSLAKKYDSLEPTAGLEKLLEDVALMSEQDQTDTRSEGVRMMTIHAAKGLEFRTVFIAGMEEGIFPHARALFSAGELEEERRLCYVALTRAKEKVFLSYANVRTHFGSTQINPPSRFLGEIPEHLLAVAEREEIIEI